MNTHFDPSETSFANYLQRMQKLKEKKVIRQVLIQELLQEVIASNQDRINEYPILETQQNSIIKLLTHWGSGYPQQEPIQKLLENFLNSLNKYEKKLYLDEKDEEFQNLQAAIHNLEILLLKCVQMVVYTQALIQDNVSEILVRYFGEDAQSILDNLLQEMEMDENFWRAVYKLFFVDFVNRIYEQLAMNYIRLSKEESKLQLFVPVDALFAYLEPTDLQVGKTRIQTMYINLDTDEDSQKIFQLVYKYLNRLIESGDSILKGAEIDFLSRTISLDPVGESLNKAYEYYLPAKDSGKNSQDKEETSKEFADLIFKQVRIMAYTASLTLNIVQNDMSRALYDLDPKKQSRAISLLDSFGLNHIANGIEYLLQCQLMNILEHNAGKDLKKISMQAVKTPRISEQALNDLYSRGLGKIGRNKLLEKDPDKKDHYLFASKNVKELQDILTTLQCDKKLAKEIYKLWKYSEVKTVITVSINLQLLAKTTANVSKKLAEILSRYKIKSSGA